MKPTLYLLVGPPLSGKDTYLSNNLKGVERISRDDVLMTLYPSVSYSEAFKIADQKLVDKVLKERIDRVISDRKDAVINMTNLTKKGRTRFLLAFPEDYTKIAVVFPKLDLSVYLERNLKRQTEENKFIPPSVINDMVNRWEEVSIDEGFDKIINL